MKILNLLSSAIANDSLSEAEKAINDYIDPLLRAAKSFYIFETNEYIRGELLETIRIYDPSFLAEEKERGITITKVNEQNS